MNDTSNRLPRRSFLTGAATVIGAASVGLAPQIAQAASSKPSGGAAGATLSLYYWTGAQFVPAAGAYGPLPQSENVQVDIAEVGPSAIVFHVDVTLPGGKFLAFSGGRPAARSLFTAASVPQGYAYAIERGGVSQTFKGVRFVGCYLAVDSTADVSNLHVVENERATVTDSSGRPSTVSGVLIQINEG